MKKCIFEISWEVCNKVGGIYTVITSKAKQAINYSDEYYLIGSYHSISSSEFLQSEIPDKYRQVYKDLLNMGIKLYFGNWNISGRPSVILVDYMGYSENTNKIKGELWEKFEIDSLNSFWHDYDGAILWSWCCGIAVELLSSVQSDSQVIVHSHEWMGGGAILYLKSIENSQIKTVFTTHATMFGRTLSSRGVDIYKEIESIDADKKSYELGVHTKHQTEKALANYADCFTTVSDITAKEAEYFYGKKADFILHNGFDDFMFEKEDLKNSKIVSYENSRKEINKFLKGYFHGFSGNLDIEKTHIFYTSGRNEFHNKGVDVLISSLGKLNLKLREEKVEKDVISLFLIPIGEYEKDSFVLESIEKFKSNEEVIHKRDFAPLSTNNIQLDNEIVKAFLDAGLYNGKEDRVKVILIPEYLNEKTGFLQRGYYDVIMGLDLGIFPSFYEPWGYTPLESIAFSVPTVTTDYSGFGLFVSKNWSCSCVGIVSRSKGDFEETSQGLCDLMNSNLNLSEDDVSNMREKSKELSKKFLWENFYKNYIDAYENLFL